MNSKRSLMIPTLSAVVAALALVGCQKKDESQSSGDKASQMQADAARKLDEAKQATKQAGQDLKEAGKDVADATANKVADATITAEVNTALARDPALSALKIDVDTSGGRVVLHGKAPDAAARDRATQLAQNVKGVVSVDNQLTVSKS
jgi:hyperosmotically inducible periplasmic protein